jgi:antitoxin ParD1/3/4
MRMGANNMNKDKSGLIREHIAEFVEDRMPEKQNATFDALRSALEKGERSGPSRPFDFDAFLVCKRKSAT